MEPDRDHLRQLQRGADLSDVALEGTVLTGAQADGTTIWPTGFDAERRRELGITETGHDSPAQVQGNEA